MRQQRLGDQRVVHRQNHRDRGAGPRHDLDGHRVGDVVAAAAAPRLGDGDAHQANRPGRARPGRAGRRPTRRWRRRAAPLPRRRSAAPRRGRPAARRRRSRSTSPIRNSNRVARAGRLRAPAVACVANSGRSRAAVWSRVLGQDARIGHDGHEVGVAVPARHEVDVQVIGDAGAGRAPEIQADVDARAAGRPSSARARRRCASGISSDSSSARRRRRAWRCAGAARPSGGRCCRERG